MEINIDNLICDENIYMIAPAGCGKTETIVNIIKKDTRKGKYLVLTHTNAGVTSLINRMNKNKISCSKYNIYTIASFTLKYIRAFPFLSKYIVSETEDYNKYYSNFINLLENEPIQDILKNTYINILIDEYQDCTITQHNIIKMLSKSISCKIFGDPLQGIFGFNGEKLIDMNTDLNDDFMYKGSFSYPWRWKSHNINLGKWIAETREKLIKKEAINLVNLPNGVDYIVQDDKGENLRKLAYGLLRKSDEKVFLFKFSNQSHDFCRRVGGIYSSQEEIACNDLLTFCKQINNKPSIEIIIEILNITKKCFTKFNDELGTIYNKLSNGNNNFNRISKNKSICEIINNIISNFTYDNCLLLMQYIDTITEMKLFRRELWYETKK